MAMHSSILAWEIHGQRSLVGYTLWGCKRVGPNNNKIFKNDIHIILNQLPVSHIMKFYSRVPACAEHPPVSACQPQHTGFLCTWVTKCKQTLYGS